MRFVHRNSRSNHSLVVTVSVMVIVRLRKVITFGSRGLGFQPDKAECRSIIFDHEVGRPVFQGVGCSCLGCQVQSSEFKGFGVEGFWGLRVVSFTV